LNYYKTVGFKGRVCVGDSSDSVHLEKTKKALQSLQGGIDIVYREYAGVNESDTLKKLLDFATPFAALVGDDDFLVPNALELCEEFLKNHPECSAVHGKSVAVSLQFKLVYGRVDWAVPYEQAVVVGETAAERILEHLKHYEATMFSVHRTETWREMYKNISLLKDRTFAAELLPCCMSVVKGKVKELDCLYLVRQDHNKRYFLPQKDRWIRNPDWASEFQTFCAILAEEVAKMDGLAVDAAAKVVSQAFDSYMVNLLGTQWRSKVGVTSPDNLLKMRHVAGKIPGVLPLWRALLSLRTAKQEEKSILQELLQPSSPFHDNFMPVYNSVTGNVPDTVLKTN
jgi:glycosyltransferase domain-containing protein